jgi:two-component system, chemotaxis family, sensor kinase CheA
MNAETTIVHVPLDRLDDLMNVVGDLVISRSALTEFANEYKAKHGYKDQVLDLLETTEAISRISEDIQTKILNARMVPVGSVFGRFRRLVRKLSENSEKEIELIIKGEATEIDKKVIEQLSEPLVHLVRNSLDHGIEPAEQREKSGKPRCGKISLNAFAQGNIIIIEVEDDGAGIDPDLVARTALERGIRSAAELEALDDAGIIELLFETGFSTKKEITEMSGRGVGTDIARKRVESLGGRLDLFSSKGQGCRWRISLPLSMAISKSLILKVADRVFALPLQQVLETVKVREEEVYRVEGKEVIDHAGEAIAIARLHQKLGLPGHSGNRSLYIAIVENSGDRFGLVFDEMVDRKEIVVRPMARRLASSRGLCGTTITNDGQVMLVLDVPSLCHATPVTLKTEHQ